MQADVCKKQKHTPKIIFIEKPKSFSILFVILPFP